MTTVCTGTIGLSDMAAYALLAVMCGFLGIGIPRMAAELVGGALGHAIEDLAAVVYMGRMFGAPAAGLAGATVRGGASAVAGGAAAQWQALIPPSPRCNRSLRMSPPRLAPGTQQNRPNP
jgi:hypothetical protein